MKRDQDWKYILKNETRTKVDKELRLYNLSARAGGASSSLVASHVRLTIAFHVLTVYETLTSIPPVVDVTSEISLSAQRSLEPLSYFSIDKFPLHCIQTLNPSFTEILYSYYYMFCGIVYVNKKKIAVVKSDII